MSSVNPVIEVYRFDSRVDHVVGDMVLHTFEGCAGVRFFRADEHAIFYRHSEVLAEIICDDERRPLHHWQPGDIGYVPSGFTMRDEKASNPYSMTIIRLPTRHVDAISKPGINSLRCHIVPRDQTFGICRAILNLARHGRRGSARFDELVDAYSSALAASMLYGAGIESADHGNSDRSLSRENVARALRFIEDNIGEQIALPDIAAAALQSTAHFSRQFAEAVGTTPMRYVWHRRAVRAQELLSGSSMPLAQIAYACGYSSQSHFTTAFRAETGLTPGAYRKQRINN